MREEIHDDVTNVHFTNLFKMRQKDGKTDRRKEGQTHLEDASRIKNVYKREKDYVSMIKSPPPLRD